MAEVVVIIKIKLSEENLSDDVFQEFLETIDKGEMQKEMFDPDLFQSLSIKYKIKSSEKG